MKKLNKVIISLALVLILALPVFVSGCFYDQDLSKIEIYTEFKTEYQYGEDLNLSNGKIKYTDKQGNISYLSITANMVDENSFDTQTLGNKQMIITYQGKTCLVDYVVYRLYDFTVGDVYYNNPSKIQQANGNSGEGYNDILKFTAINKASVGVSQTTELDYPVTLTLSKAVVNYQTVYTATTDGAEFTITFISATQLHFSGIQSGITLEFDMIKYVA